jgi:hypothetical protein
MDRRKSTICMLALAVSPFAEAQPSARPRRIGFLAYSTSLAGRVYLAAFTDELAKLGWING